MLYNALKCRYATLPCRSPLEKTVYLFNEKNKTLSVCDTFFISQ